jgi:predicted lactoylglutathione lyase
VFDISCFDMPGPMDIIAGYTGKWKQKVDEISKKAEEAAGNVWQHRKSAPKTYLVEMHIF